MFNIDSLKEKITQFQMSVFFVLFSLFVSHYYQFVIAMRTEKAITAISTIASHNNNQYDEDRTSETVKRCQNPNIY